jgi:hypothetical protein
MDTSTSMRINNQHHNNNEKYVMILEPLRDYMFYLSFVNKNSLKDSQVNINVKQLTSNDTCTKPAIKMQTNKKKNIENDNTFGECNSNDLNKKNDIYFNPREKDKLFWCFFVLLNGMEDYELNKSSSFEKEKSMKISAIETLKNYKDKLKSYKISFVDAQEDLVNNPIISTIGLQLLCMIYNMNILYVKNRIYYEIYNDYSKPLNVIINIDGHVYIPDNINENKINEYKNNYFKIENIYKPINSISSYSLVELQDIAIKLNIPIELDKKKLLKKDLYENIVRNL